MPYESPYAKPAPAQGLRAKVPGPVKLPAKKKPAQPEAGGLLAGAASAVKNRKKLLDSL